MPSSPASASIYTKYAVTRFSSLVPKLGRRLGLTSSTNTIPDEESDTSPVLPRLSTGSNGATVTGAPPQLLLPVAVTPLRSITSMRRQQGHWLTLLPSVLSFASGFLFVASR